MIMFHIIVVQPSKSRYCGLAKMTSLTPLPLFVECITIHPVSVWGSTTSFTTIFQVTNIGKYLPGGEYLQSSS